MVDRNDIQKRAYLKAYTSDFKRSGVSLLQLDDDLLQIDYMNNLTNTFMDQWDRSKSKKRFDHVKPE